MMGILFAASSKYCSCFEVSAIVFSFITLLIQVMQLTSLLGCVVKLMVIIAIMCPYYLGGVYVYLHMSISDLVDHFC